MMKHFLERAFEILVYTIRFIVFVTPISVLEGLALIMFSKKEIVSTKLILKPAKSEQDRISIIDKLNMDNIDLYKMNAPVDDIEYDDND